MVMMVKKKGKKGRREYLVYVRVKLKREIFKKIFSNLFYKCLFLNAKTWKEKRKEGQREEKEERKITPIFPVLALVI